MLYDAKRWDKCSPIVDALRIGRDRVAKGWCQRFGSTKEGVYCAYWAITEQFERREDAMPVLAYLRQAVGRPDIIEWNDSTVRTQADVVAAYDSAIELAVSEVADGRQRTRSMEKRHAA